MQEAAGNVYNPVSHTKTGRGFLTRSWWDSNIKLSHQSPVVMSVRQWAKYWEGNCDQTKAEFYLAVSKLLENAGMARDCKLEAVLVF